MTAFVKTLVVGFALLTVACASSGSGAASRPVQSGAKSLTLPSKGVVTALAEAPSRGANRGDLYAAVDAPGNRTILYRSVDGDSWERTTILDRAGQVFGMVFWSPTDGFILHGSGDSAVLYKANFGAGRHDLTIAARIPGRFVRLVAAGPPSLDGEPHALLLLGSDASGRGVVLRTLDGSNLESVARFESDAPALVAGYVKYHDREFLVGGSGGRGGLYTGRLGGTFARILLDDVPNLTSIDFDALGNGLAAGARGELLRSADGGLTWAPSLSGTETDLSTVRFVGDRRAYLCGRSGTVLYTSDAGLTVQPVHLGRREDFWGLLPAGDGVRVLGAVGTVPFIGAPR